MDGQNWLESYRVPVPIVADDVPFGGAHLVDLFAAPLSAAAAAPSAGRLDLPETAPAATKAGTWPKSKVLSLKSKVRL